MRLWWARLDLRLGRALTLAKLPLKEQDEVMAFLFHLRHAQDRTYHEQISRRMQDKDPAHWLTAEQFERELGENQ
jgi:hypothetical protein